MLSRWQLNRVAGILNSGGVIAYPTESVYGLGCDPDNDSALQKILSIKKRPARKGLIILVSEIAQAQPFIKPLTAEQLQIMNAQQSRATTWLIPRHEEVSPLLCGQFDSLAVRVTSHPIARAICEFTGRALVSTSCNSAGKPEMKRKSQVRNHMGPQLDYIVEGRCGGQNPSQIIDITSGRVIRQ